MSAVKKYRYKCRNQNNPEYYYSQFEYIGDIISNEPILPNDHIIINNNSYRVLIREFTNNYAILYCEECTICYHKNIIKDNER